MALLFVRRTDRPTSPGCRSRKFDCPREGASGKSTGFLRLLTVTGAFRFRPTSCVCFATYFFVIRIFCIFLVLCDLLLLATNGEDVVMFMVPFVPLFILIVSLNQWEQSDDVERLFAPLVSFVFRAPSFFFPGLFLAPC